MVATIGEYLIQRLHDYGARHVFGIPGDYALPFFHQLENSPLKLINTCDEQGAGFAADAYARLKGIGVVCVTYCVGGLKIANTTAEAYAEKSPVVVISGAPGTDERAKNPLLHHKIREFDTQFKVFEQLTVAQAFLNDPETAAREIDRVLHAAVTHKRPVYIEMPRNIANTKLGYSGPAHIFESAVSDPDVLKEAMREAIDMINAARQPVILAGVEIHRFGLQKQLLRLIAETNIPVASTLLSKSVLPEKIPAHLGVYEGAMGHEDVRKYVETSDCLILLGALMSDVDMGIFTAKLDPACSISVTSEKTSIRFHTYENIRLEDFMKELTDSDIHQRGLAGLPHPEPPPAFHAVKNAVMTTARLFQRINTFLNEETIVIADPGDAMFSAADLYIQGGTEFLSPAYYTSMGFSVPASIGVQLANPKMRPLVLVGDGAFQMTGMELTTSFRYGLNPIVVILNNKGYGTERPMQEGKFNDLINWNYHKIPDVIGAGRGFEIHTEDQLEQALQISREHTETFAILNVHLDPKDLSPALQRFTQSLGKKIH